MGDSSRRVFRSPQPALKMSAGRPAGVLQEFRDDSCHSPIEECRYTLCRMVLEH